MKKKDKKLDAFSSALAAHVTKEIKDFALQECKDPEFTCNPEEVVEVNLFIEPNKAEIALYERLKEEYSNLLKNIEENLLKNIEEK